MACILQFLFLTRCRESCSWRQCHHAVSRCFSSGSPARRCLTFSSPQNSMVPSMVNSRFACFLSPILKCRYESVHGRRIYLCSSRFVVLAWNASILFVPPSMSLVIFAQRRSKHAFSSIERKWRWHRRSARTWSSLVVGSRTSSSNRVGVIEIIFWSCPLMSYDVKRLFLDFVMYLNLFNCELRWNFATCSSTASRNNCVL